MQKGSDLGSIINSGFLDPETGIPIITSLKYEGMETGDISFFDCGPEQVVHIESIKPRSRKAVRKLLKNSGISEVLRERGFMVSVLEKNAGENNDVPSIIRLVKPVTDYKYKPQFLA